MKLLGAFFSFRLRMALLAGSLTAVFVIIACWGLWNLTYRFNLETIDAAIDRIGRSSLERVSGQSYWSRLDDSLSVLAGSEPNAQIYTIYVDNTDRHVFHSVLWPKGIDEQRKDAIDRIAAGPGDPPQQPRRGEPVSEANPALPILGNAFATVADFEGRRWRLGVLRNHYQSLAIALDMTAFEKNMDTLRNRFLAVLPFALLGVGAMAWWFAQRSLKPVSRLAAAVEKVDASGLDYRVDLERYDPEYKRLAIMFNEMLERLESSFYQASRFSSDASHELKTPLARLQMELESALEEAPIGSPQQTVYSNLLVEIGRLKGIADKLSLLSLSDAGNLPLNRERLDLGRIVHRVVEDWEVLAMDRPLKIDIEEGVFVQADALLLEQAIQNLMSNALKYGKAKSAVEVRLSRENGQVSITVSNIGDAIPASEQARIFDRFYRSDEARSTAVGGTGLGLSLTREILKAHGGQLHLQRSDGERTVFELIL